MAKRAKRPTRTPGRVGSELTLGEELGADLSSTGPMARHTDKYLRSLMLLLVAATFFEGYDGAILALVLGSIRDTFNVAESQLGISRAIIELGLGGRVLPRPGR